MNIFYLMILLVIFLPVEIATDDGAIIFEEEETGSPMLVDSIPLALAEEESFDARQKYQSTFRQPGLKANSPCRDARFAIGTCLTLMQCPALLRIAMDRKNPDYPFLQYSICGNFQGSQYFCCKRSLIVSQTTTNPPRSKPTISVAPTRTSTLKQSTPAPSRSCITSNDINFESCGTSKLFGNRVVGGKASEPNSSPWIALVLRSSIAACGASLITNQHAISAAHCFVEAFTGTIVRENEITLRLAEHDLSTLSDGKHFDMEVEEIRPHEKYSMKDFRNDIAVVKMKRKVCFSARVKPICIPGPEWNLKQLELYKAIVAGWGFVNPEGRSPTVLQQGELSIYNTNECRANYSVIYRSQSAAIDGTTICSGDSEGKVDSCNGDSGGPLIVSQEGKFYLVGVVSRGPKYCGTAGLPGIYTKISVYYDWIVRNIQ